MHEGTEVVFTVKGSDRSDNDNDREKKRATRIQILPKVRLPSPSTRTVPYCIAIYIPYCSLFFDIVTLHFIHTVITFTKK